MYIKYVLIKKFKSYRELSYMEPLSERVNVVIGANGHGKSNFLDAIIFVLTDKYSNLRGEDKKLLVHEEANENINQISVELIIDNKSRRFPVDKDTVSITKIYHVEENREEILINGKKLMRSDVYNLLESAGFCKSHPYYIIQQGKINTIINMNEFELFEQFAEVTGTSIYEEKKSESLKLLEDAKENKQKISRQREEINDFILRLESQCEDLVAFEKFEAKKKACEFFIFNEKVADLQVQVDLLQERRASCSSSLQGLCTNLNLLREKISEKISLGVKLNKHIQNLKGKLDRLENESSQIQQITTKQQANLQRFHEGAETNTNQKKEIEASIKVLLQEKEKTKLDALRTAQKVRDLESEMENLMLKFNRLKGSSEYEGILKNKGKTFLINEIKSITRSKEDINDKILALNTNLKDDELSYENLTKNIKQSEVSSQEITSGLKSVNEKLIECKRRRVEILTNMKKIDIDANEIEEEIFSLKESQKQSERIMPNIDVVKAISEIKKLNLPGFYGCILDLIKVDKRYRNILDIFAKDKLFSLVVDSLETADKILEYNKSRNGPVIDILPCEWNQNSQPIIYPQTSDAVPLIQFIDLVDHSNKNTLYPIIEKIFGKCLLVKNYEVAMNLAKNYKLTCVTPENEIVFAGAYITKVGHYDYKRNRCALYDIIQEIQTKLYQLTETKSHLELSRQSLANEENQILREQNQTINIKNDLSYKLISFNKSKQSLEEDVLSIKEIIEDRKKIIEQSLREKSFLEQKLSSLNMITNKSSQDISKELSEEEKNEILKMENKLIELEKAKNLLVNQKMNLESNLDFLNKKEIQLNSQLNEISTSHEESSFNFSEEKAVIEDIESYMKELENLGLFKKRVLDEINKSEKEADNLNNEIGSMKSDSNKINERINKNEAELKAVVLSLNDSNEKKASLLKNIAALGQIKSEYLEKYSKLKEAQIKLLQNESGIDVRDTEKKLNKILQPIYSSLENTNRKMKKFEKINRFALDDYKLFKEKREEVTEKMADLQGKENELLEVIKVLDQKKESAIQTTFEKVSKSFEYFFKELVPNGYASLSLDSVNTGLSQKSSQPGNYLKAIFINVSFSGIQNSAQSMNQLSGGQKTAVAVALIFALSKIDPPPFYILDEIDAALDPAMRINLASLIKELSKNNQYIISSFKHEVLEVSENIYQVKFTNKTSNFNKISQEEAQKFIKDINI
jgi:structural maintenance of chromosome 3 (chondroitin sulfate proteoglycan 6)